MQRWVRWVSTTSLACVWTLDSNVRPWRLAEPPLAKHVIAAPAALEYVAGSDRARGSLHIAAHGHGLDSLWSRCRSADCVVTSAEAQILAAGIEVAHVFGPSAMRMGAPDRTSAVSLDPLPLGIERATRCKSIVRAAQEGRRPRRACEQARTIRCQARWPMRELPAAQIVCVDTHEASEHRAPADEVIRCGRGDRAWMRAVTVLEIAVSAGVDVPDVRVVDDDRIRCVDMSNVTRRMAIP